MIRGDILSLVTILGDSPAYHSRYHVILVVIRKIIRFQPEDRGHQKHRFYYGSA